MNAAQQMGLHLIEISVAKVEEFEGAFEAATAQHAQAIDVLASPYFNANRACLIELAAKYRMPAIYESRDYVQSGGLMSYGPDLAALFRRAAIYVDKILKGAKPGDLPVEQATNFELVINLRAAKEIGVTITPAVLASADELIE